MNIIIMNINIIMKPGFLNHFINVKHPESIFKCPMKSDEVWLIFHGLVSEDKLSWLVSLFYVNDVGSSEQNGQLIQYTDDTNLRFKASPNQQ